MPGLDGIETTKLINEKCAIEDTPTVIMVSAFRQESIVKLASDVGIQSFLQKPINPSILNDVLSKTFLTEIKNDYANEIETKSLIHDIRTLGGSKILLTEDNDINQELILGLLENSGISIDIATNGKEAVELFKYNATQELKYELILMDLQMPVMDGYEATQVIRELNKKIPIIALTANAMKEDVIKTQSVGMNEHINKPIEVEKLYETLLKYISKKVENHQLENIDQNAEKSHVIIPDFQGKITLIKYKDII